MAKRRKGLRSRFSRKEFRASLNFLNKAKLIKIIMILFSSASITAKNKVGKIAASSMARRPRRSKSKARRKSKTRKNSKRRKSKRRVKSRRRKSSGRGKIRTITVKMKNGKRRKQKARVLANGKLRFIKN